MILPTSYFLILHNLFQSNRVPLQPQHGYGITTSAWDIYKRASESESLKFSSQSRRSFYYFIKERKITMKVMKLQIILILTMLLRLAPMILTDMVDGYVRKYVVKDVSDDDGVAEDLEQSEMLDNGCNTGISRIFRPGFGICILRRCCVCGIGWGRRFCTCFPHKVCS